MTESRDACIARLRGFLLAKKPDLPAYAVTEDADLLASGLLDSFAFVEFLMFVEEQCGRAVLGEDVDPASFRSLASIYDTYYVGVTARERRAP